MSVNGGACIRIEMWGSVVLWVCLMSSQVVGGYVDDDLEKFEGELFGPLVATRYC